MGRNNQDIISNQFGKRFIDMCKHTNLCILNGRKIGDIEGRYTCQHYNGSSVVDYCAVSRLLYKQVLYFKVLKLSHISDHCPIKMCLNVGGKYIKLQETESYDKFPKGFNWHINSNVNYSDVINSFKYVNRCNALHNNIYNIDSIGINRLCDDISTVLIGAAQQSLLRVKSKRKRHLNTKWYNKTLEKLKCDTLHIGKLLRKYPRDPFIRGKFISRKKQYKQACRAAKRKYINDISCKLDSLQSKNSKDFWALLNSLKQNKAHSAERPDMEKLFEKFKSLYKNHSENTSVSEREFIDQIEHIVNSQQSGKSIPDLDKPFAVDELLKCVKNLKNGKSSGQDLVMNEMIKTH